MIFRQMKESDIIQAADLEKKSFTEPWSEQAFRESLQTKGVYYFIAEENGQLVGNCGLRNAAGEGEITNVAVMEEFRGRGIAYQLLQSLMEEGRRIGIEAYTLEVRSHNKPAIALYEKCGFVSEGIHPMFYRNPPDDAVIMWKRQGV